MNKPSVKDIIKIIEETKEPTVITFSPHKWTVEVYRHAIVLKSKEIEKK